MQTRFLWNLHSETSATSVYMNEWGNSIKFKGTICNKPEGRVQFSIWIYIYHSILNYVYFGNHNSFGVSLLSSCQMYTRLLWERKGFLFFIFQLFPNKFWSWKGKYLQTNDVEIFFVSLYFVVFHNVFELRVM